MIPVNYTFLPHTETTVEGVILLLSPNAVVEGHSRQGNTVPLRHPLLRMHTQFTAHDTLAAALFHLYFVGTSSLMYSKLLCSRPKLGWLGVNFLLKESLTVRVLTALRVTSRFSNCRNFSLIRNTTNSFKLWQEREWIWTFDLCIPMQSPI